ncbi:CHAT domain-containing protein, partial [Crucibulum laeve]
NLGDAFRSRYTYASEISDLNESVVVLRRAIECLIPSNFQNLLPSAYLNLSNALLTRHDCTSQDGDMEESISVLRQALELLPSTDERRAFLLHAMGNVLKQRFFQRGQQVDLAEAVASFKQSLEIYGGNSLRISYNFSDQVEDLDESISFFRKALHILPPIHEFRGNCLSNFALALQERYKISGNQNELEETISILKEALELYPASHVYRPLCLEYIADALRTRYNEYGGERSELEEAIAYARRSLELLVESHPGHIGPLHCLGLLLGMRSSATSSDDDMEESITLLRKSVELCAPSDARYFNYLNNFASALGKRYKRKGQPTDLDEAILCLRLLISIGQVYLNKYGQDHKHEDFSQSKLFFEQALEMNPILLQRLECMFTLGELFAIRNQSSKCSQLPVGYLDESISVYRRTIELQPPPSRELSSFCNTSATAFVTRYHKTGDKGDLEEGISILTEALNEFQQRNDAETYVLLANIGESFMFAYEQDPDPGYLDKAFASFRSSVENTSAPVSSRFGSAKKWANYADKYGWYECALEAYEKAIGLLPQISALSYDIKRRQKSLASGTNGLAQSAAVCAARLGYKERAVELLEAGRGIFWSQTLQLRSPLNDLEDIAPELTEKLYAIATALESGSFQERTALDNLGRISVEEETSRLQKLNDEWIKTLDEVRMLDGFSHFLLPPRLHALQKACTSGPIVILVPHKLSSFAFLMTESEIIDIPLPNLPLETIESLVGMLKAAIIPSNESMKRVEEIIKKTSLIPLFRSIDRSGRLAKTATRSSDEIFHLVLGILWDEIVNLVVRELGLKKSIKPPLLRWCPTGPFSFLPLHAAGRYSSISMTDCAPDYIVSSYIPTLGSLLLQESTVAASSEARGPLKMLAVIQPEVLPATIDEMKKIERHVPSSDLIKLGVPGAPAGVEDVISQLSTASICHFACHGNQDSLNPLDSALLLEDGPLKISRIMQHPMPHATLAFLCACETAMGDKELPDEAISLGASLLFSGFGSVIATMWAIADNDGPQIVDSFYERIFDRESNGFPTCRSAEALHKAVIKLRRLNVPFVRWIPFIHMGQ